MHFQNYAPFSLTPFSFQQNILAFGGVWAK